MLCIVIFSEFLLVSPMFYHHDHLVEGGGPMQLVNIMTIMITITTTIIIIITTIIITITIVMTIIITWWKEEDLCRGSPPWLVTTKL